MLKEISPEGHYTLTPGEGQNIVKMIRCEVLFNHNQVMADGLGNTKKQAERNASINGLAWLRDNKLLNE